MKSRLMSLVFALPLVLVGCGADRESDLDKQAREAGFEQAPDMAEIDEKLNPTGKGAVDHKWDEPIPITCYSHAPCEGSLKLTEISFGGECEWGIVDYIDNDDPPEGTVLLQLKGEFEVSSAMGGSSLLDDPSVIDKDGFTNSTQGISMCVDKKDGYEPWATPVDVGQKIKAYGSWFVNENAEFLLLNNKKIKLPAMKPSEISENTTDSPVPTSAASQPTETAPNPPQNQTPGCVGPAAICGYGTDEYGNPNPSSGEIQTLHGCEEGYITDPNLCEAVQGKANEYGW